LSSPPLNPAQREAVRYLDGPCLVLAGAGSGKTRVITRKIAYLIEEASYDPRHVAAVTFTNKAAREMQERVGELVGSKAAKALTVCTFHALGVKLLRMEAAQLGLKPQFSILDADDAFGILQELLATTDKQLIRRAQNRISLWKNALVTPDEAAHTAANEDEVQAARVYRSYNATLTAYQAVDFDDLIRLPAELLAANEEARNRWQGRIRYLLVDEYQDTNACQYRLVRLLTGPRAQFTAVGDDDQAIYAWRGATVDNLAQLPKDYPQLKVIKLEQNYRSTVRILTAANNVIANNPKLFEKKLWSEHGAGDPVSIVAMNDDEHEAESVAIKLSAHRFERRAKWSDYAILARGNYQMRVFEQALRKEKIPYVVSGGQSFFERSEIKDITSYLRLIANEDDDPAFIRAITTPKRGVGAATLEVLGQYAGERQVSLFEALFETGFANRAQPRQLEPLKTFGEFINKLQYRAAKEPAGQVLADLMKAINYEAYLFDSHDERAAQTKWQNVIDFTQWLTTKGEEDGKTLLDLTQTVALLTMLDKNEKDLDAVRVSTLHAAKGLEFPHVFLVGVEEGLLPHASRDEEADAETLVSRIEEERRLMYVGITRAQRSLHVSWCQKRKRAKEMEVREASRFIKEMGLETAPKLSAEEAQVSSKDRLANLKALLSKPRVA
jgi:ATP-dependent DNA helicase Rep